MSAVAARLTWPRRIGWAAGDAGMNFYWQGVGIFLYFFYTDVMKIPPGWAGVAFGIASFWDAVADPIMGTLADRTRSRFGRFRPWLLFGSVPCAFAFVLLFYTPPLTGSWLIGYAVVTHILFRTLYAAISIPFGALSARLTLDTTERGTIAMLRLMFAASGALIVAFTVPKLVGILGDPRHAYLVAAIILATGATVIFGIVFLSTTEVVETDDAPPVRTRHPVAGFVHDIAGFWLTLRYNRPLAQMFGAVIFSGITTTLNSKMLLYWIKYDLKEPQAMAWLLPLPAFVLLVVAPMWNRVAQRWSKRNAWWAGAALSSMSLTAFYVINPHDYHILIPIMVIGATGGSAGFIMFWSMLPDTVEFNEWVRGERSEAKIFGFATFGQKAALAINAILLGFMLSHVGFVADQVQPAATLADMRVMMCLIPLAGVIGSALLLWGYPIDAVFHAKLREDIAARAINA